MTALKTLEVGEMEKRIAALEAAVLGNKALPELVSDADQDDDSISEMA